MKPYIRGKTIYFREVTIDDADFIVRLRTDPEKGKHISSTAQDIDSQRRYISNYLRGETDYYFIICDWGDRPLGTVRIYDIRNDSFCWGSWILSSDAPTNAAIESALLIYDFAFFSLHFTKSHFDVRKENCRVVEFHKRFGASIVREDDQDAYFEYSLEKYLAVRSKYRRFLP